MTPVKPRKPQLHRYKTLWTCRFPGDMILRGFGNTPKEAYEVWKRQVLELNPKWRAYYGFGSVIVDGKS